jgi:hypothetical protein
MPSTHTSVRPISTHPTYTSRLVFNSCRMVKHLLEPQIKAMHLYPRMYILRLISLRRFMVQLLRSGVLLNLSSLLKALHPQLWRLVGIALWLRSAIRIYRLSN